MTRTCLLFRNDNSFKVLKYNISQSDIQLTKIVTERYPAKGDSCSSRIFYDLPEASDLQITSIKRNIYVL